MRSLFLSLFLFAFSSPQALVGAESVKPLFKKDPGRYDILILDWDNTLLCTEYLHRENLGLYTVLSSSEQDILQNYTARVVAFLDRVLASGFDSIIIVTNATHVWIELSARKYMPLLYDKFKLDRPSERPFTIVSGKSTYEALYPGKKIIWKYLAMRGAIDQRPWAWGQHRPLHVFSIGDSHIERYAAKLLTETWSDTRTKTIKLIGNPSPDDLMRQHTSLANSFAWIYAQDRDLDLHVTFGRQVDESAGALK